MPARARINGRSEEPNSRWHLTSVVLVVLLALAATGIATAQEEGASEENRMAELAKMTQDPLASVSAVVSDNTFNFKTGEDEGTAYNLQLQPVYSLNGKSVNYIPRAVIPLLGAPKTTELPGLGPVGPAEGFDWGLSDTVVQLFITPRSDSSLKWGLGPQVSLKTRTNDSLGGAGWGGGLAGVLVGGSGAFSFAMILGNLWGEDDFNTMVFQPGMYYNFPQVSGLSLSYQAVVTANWSAPSGEQKWTVPLGAQLGKLFDLGKGYAIDVSAGPYYIAVGSENGPEWQVKLNIFVVFPR